MAGRSAAPKPLPSQKHEAEEAERASVARLLNSVALAVALVVTPFSLAMILVMPSQWLRWIAVVGVLDAVCAATIFLVRRRRVTEAAWFFLSVAWLALTYAAWTAGGLDAPSIMAQLVFVVLAGMLLGWRRGLLAALLAVATIFFMAWAQTAGVMPAPMITHTPLSRAMTLTTYIVALAFLQVIIMRSLNRTRDNAVSALRERRAAEKRLSDIIDNAPLGALGFELRSDGHLVTTNANASASRILGIDASRFVGMEAETVLAGPGGTALTRQLHAIAENGGTQETETFRWRVDDRARVFRLQAFQTGTGLAAIFFSDVTERHQAEEAMRHMAFHDALTGLPNRALLYDHLDIALASAERRGDRVGLLFLDLDNFKPLNDRYGHAFGDEVLIAVGRRLSANARAGDTVARLGGDEFTVLLPDIEGEHQVEVVARKILGVLEQPVEVAGRTVRVSASIGVAVTLDGELDATTLFHRADLAMYRMKAQGRGGYHFYEAGLDDAHQKRNKDLR